METIQNEKWKLVIDLNGGRIRELKNKDKLVLGTFSRIDGKQGNTHVCCPNFGGEGVERFGFPFHGPFRNNQWTLVNKSNYKLEIESVDLGMKVKQVFELSDSFKQKIIVKSLIRESRVINLAIHNYWDTKGGWVGVKLNGKVIDELIKSDTDMEILSVNILEIPGKRVYKWSVKGFKYQRFWTAFKEIAGVKKYDQNYICIEPSLEKQGFLDNENGFNLSGLGSLEVVQTIETMG